MSYKEHSVIKRPKIPEQEKPQEPLPSKPETDKTLSEIIGLIPTYAPNLDEINKIAVAVGRRPFFGSKAEVAEVMGIIAEYHLYYVFSCLSASYPINLFPIEDGTQKGGYSFKKVGINYEVTWKRGEQCNYDLITEIGGAPVFWEVKIGKLDKATGNTRTNRLQRPINAIYGNDGV
jgi:hypothetical protein